MGLPSLMLWLVAAARGGGGALFDGVLMNTPIQGLGGFLSPSRSLGRVYGYTGRGVSFKGLVNKGNTSHLARSPIATHYSSDVTVTSQGSKASGDTLLCGSQKKMSVRCGAQTQYLIYSFPSEKTRPSSPHCAETRGCDTYLCCLPHHKHWIPEDQ